MLAQNLHSINGSHLKTEIKHSKFKTQEQRDKKANKVSPRTSARLREHTCYTIVNVGISVACFILLVCCLAITSGIIQVVSYQSKTLNLTILQVLTSNHSWLSLSAWIVADGFLAVLLVASLYIPFVVVPTRRNLNSRS